MTFVFVDADRSSWAMPQIRPKRDRTGRRPEHTCIHAAVRLLWSQTQLELELLTAALQLVFPSFPTGPDLPSLTNNTLIPIFCAALGVDE